MSSWRTCTKSNRCPICESDHYCSVTDDDTCCQCSHSKRKGTVLPAPAGWSMWKATNGGGMLYRAQGPDGKPVEIARESEAERERKEEAERYFKQKGIEHAQNIYTQAGRHLDQRVHAVDYLAARGIDVARLPGGDGGISGLPKAIRFDRSCVDGSLTKGVTKAMSRQSGEAVRPSLQLGWPAMVCGVADENGELMGVHRTFLSIAWRRAESGPIELRTVLNEAGEYERVERFTEGRWEIVPRKRTDWEVPAELKTRDSSGKVIKGSWTGVGAAKKMLGECVGSAVRLGREFPEGVLLLGEGIENTLAAMQATGWTGFALLSENGVRQFKLPAAVFDRGLGSGVNRVIILQDLEYSKSHKSGDAGQSVGVAAGGILANRILTACPWLIVQRYTPGHEHCPQLVDVDGKPILEKGKSVGCLDVLNAAGVAALKAGILSAPTFGGDGDAAALPPTPPIAPGGLSSGGTRADGFTSGGTGGSRDGGNSDLYEPNAWHEMPIIADGPVNQARRYLVECCMEEGQSRFGLVRWAEKWWQYVGGAYREVNEDRLIAMVQSWLNGFRRLHREKPVPFNPKTEDAKQVVAALAIDCVVDAESVPVWLPPSIVANEEGQLVPQWGLSAVRTMNASESRVVDGVESRAPMNLVFPNGRVDMGQLLRTRKVVLEPHTPELFSTTKFPYELPIEELQAVIDAKSDSEMDEIYQRICPRTYSWLMDASTLDPEGECDRKWIRQLQEMLGDTVSGDRSIEKIFMAVGIKRSGKGICGVILETVVGSENIQSLNATMLMDKYGTAALVGKIAALWPDAHVAKFDDGGPIVEQLKSIRGRDRLPIRDLYKGYTTARIGARIWITANELLDLRDDSGAFAGSLIVLPMRKTAEGREDEALKDDIRAEGPGLMTFALAGAVRLWSKKPRRIEMSDDGKEVAEDYAKASAHIQEFVKECIVFDESARGLLPADAYKAYEWWCTTQEHRQPKGRQKFYSAMTWHMPKLVQPRAAVEIEGKIVTRRDRVYPERRLSLDAEQGAKLVGTKVTAYPPHPRTDEQNYLPGGF